MSPLHAENTRNVRPLPCFFALAACIFGPAPCIFTGPIQLHRVLRSGECGSDGMMDVVVECVEGAKCMHFVLIHFL